MAEALGFVLGLALLVYLARRFPLLWWAIGIALVARLVG